MSTPDHGEQRPAAHPHPGPDRHPRPTVTVTRRTVVRAAAWSTPVIALVAAAPAASASGDPTFTAVGPFGSATSQVFTIVTSNLPAVPAGSEGDYEGVLIGFCLPEGLRVTAVTTPGWSFYNTADNIDGPPDPYAGREAFVYNSVALAAGADPTIDVIIGLDPALTQLDGTLGADVSIGTTGYFTGLEWPYAYGGSSADPLPNCASSASLGSGSTPR